MGELFSGYYDDSNKELHQRKITTTSIGWVFWQFISS
jgi:hypothetical protein